jgi:hypothetical protein
LEPHVVGVEALVGRRLRLKAECGGIAVDDS